MASPPLNIPKGKKIRVEITPLATMTPLQGRLQGVAGAEATPQPTTDLVVPYLRPALSADPTGLSQDDLIMIEQQLRDAAGSTSDLFVLGLDAAPALEQGSGQLLPLGPGAGSSLLPGLFGGGVPGAGMYQLMSFPVSRFNGIPLPAGSSIRFADPGRWFGGAMETRLFTISVDGTKKFFSWDAHLPVGNKIHPYYHVNQKGMAAVMGASDHAALTGTALVQARQLRYLKIGGRVFLVAGVIIDTAQLAAAGYESYQTGSVKPIGKQAVKTATGWAAAWAGPRRELRSVPWQASKRAPASS